jgi:hypothetical protein
MPGKNLGGKDTTICQNVSNFDVRLIGDLNSFLNKKTRPPDAFRVKKMSLQYSRRRGFY